MKHLKLFEENTQEQKLYICSIIDHSTWIDKDDIFLFYNKNDMNNFLINYIQEDFNNSGDTTIDNIFDIDKLIEEFNEGDTKIYLNTGTILKNVKLNPEIEIKMSAKKYNI